MDSAPLFEELAFAREEVKRCPPSMVSPLYPKPFQESLIPHPHPRPWSPPFLALLRSQQAEHSSMMSAFDRKLFTLRPTFKVLTLIGDRCLDWAL